MCGDRRDCEEETDMEDSWTMQQIENTDGEGGWIENNKERCGVVVEAIQTHCCL